MPPRSEDDFWTGRHGAAGDLLPDSGAAGHRQPRGILDDANPLGVGVIQYLTNVGQIMADLTSSITPGLADGSLAPLSFTGNSLGAALAQQFALTALDPLGTLAGIETNLLSGPLEDLEPPELGSITSINWLGLLGAAASIAVLADLTSDDGSDDDSDGPLDAMAALGTDLVASLEGYAQAIANLIDADLDGTGLPLYRLVGFHVPGIQEWQFESLTTSWESQPIADVSYQLSIGDVVALAGDLHLPGEVSFRGFDPLRNSPHLPGDIDGLVSGFVNLHSNLAFHPVGLTAYSNLAEAPGEQLIQLIDNDTPLRLDSSAPADDTKVIHRIGAVEAADDDSSAAVMAGFGVGRQFRRWW